tara:strand:+ start:1168 stop:1794 length:627 start_codon:yes stop_codon:yes gene_type:complete
MGKKRGLWDNVHAKRARGEAPAKPGDKDYPETLNVKDGGKIGYKEGGVVKGSKKDLKVIVKELLNASKMHKGQSKRIDKHLKMMKHGGKVGYEDGGKVQILAEKDGKAIYTSKDQYDAGKIISEDEENVVVQIPKSIFQSGFTEADYNKYGYGSMLNQWALENEIKIPRELHGGEGKDTTFVTANPLKHKLTKPVNFDFPTKDGRSKK